MPLCRFEITQGGAIDIVEVECDDVEHIRAEALRLAKTRINDLTVGIWDKPVWALRVTDESRISILALTLASP
jgi:hypothetical protein